MGFADERVDQSGQHSHARDEGQGHAVPGKLDLQGQVQYPHDGTSQDVQEKPHAEPFPQVFLLRGLFNGFVAVQQAQEQRRYKRAGRGQRPKQVGGRFTEIADLGNAERIQPGFYGDGDKVLGNAAEQSYQNGGRAGLVAFQQVRLVGGKLEDKDAPEHERAENEQVGQPLFQDGFDQGFAVFEFRLKHDPQQRRAQYFQSGKVFDGEHPQGANP